MSIFSYYLKFNSLSITHILLLMIITELTLTEVIQLKTFLKNLSIKKFLLLNN